MSYKNAFALQEAVFARLAADAEVQSLTGGQVYDAMPAGPLPALYVVLGDEAVKDASDATGGGARHDLMLFIVSTDAGFQSAKAVAAAVAGALDGQNLNLSQGRLVGLWFLKARARRTSDGARRIDLTFRARVEDN